MCIYRNLVDAANVAALAALLSFRRPECTIGGPGGQDIIVHPPEVWQSFMRDIYLFCVILHIYHNPFQVREPVPLIIHFLPVSVTFGLLGDGEFVVPSSFLMLTHTRVCNGHILTMYNIAGHGPNLPRRDVNERKTDC